MEVVLVGKHQDKRCNVVNKSHVCRIWVYCGVNVKGDD